MKSYLNMYKMKLNMLNYFFFPFLFSSLFILQGLITVIIFQKIIFRYTKIFI